MSPVSEISLNNLCIKLEFRYKHSIVQAEAFKGVFILSGGQSAFENERWEINYDGLLTVTPLGSKAPASPNKKTHLWGVDATFCP